MFNRIAHLLSWIRPKKNEDSENNLSQVIMEVSSSSSSNADIEFKKAKEGGLAVGEDKDIDFVLVWDSESTDAISERSIEKRDVFEKNLEKEGLILDKEIVKNLHFVKIKAPFEVLQTYAGKLKIQFPLKTEDADTEDKPAEEQKPSIFSQILEKCCGKKQPKLSITSPYSKSKYYLFDIDESNASLYFTSAIRSRIVHFILRRNRFKDDDGKDPMAFGYERLIAKSVYSDAYHLHDGDRKSLSCERGLLYKYWACFRNIYKRQPLDAIQSYFGVNIAFYFGFLGFYTRMLIFPAILGFFCFIYGVSTAATDQYTNDLCSSDYKMCPHCEGKYVDSECSQYWELSSICFYSKLSHAFDNDATAGFAIFMSIWTVLFLRYWKQQRAELTNRWNLNQFDDKDQVPRQEFIAKAKEKAKANKNSNKKEDEKLVLPFWKVKLPYTIFSLSIVFFLMSIALGAVVGVFIYRVSIGLFFDSRIMISITAALMNVTFILLFSQIYHSLAKWLTELEIPRTIQEFEWSFGIKLYVFEFINHYSSIIYVAYFKGRFTGTPVRHNRLFGRWRHEECQVSCMPELCIQLAIIMIVKQAKSALLEFIVPALLKRWRKLRHKSNKVKEEEPTRQILKDYYLLPWDDLGLTSEYLETMIQFGFVTLFSAAFPLAPLFAFLNNIFEVRLDARKLLKFYRRPVATRAKGIGVWFPIMDTVSKFAILSNAIIIASTSNFIPKFMYRYLNNGNSDGTLKGFLDVTLTEYSVHDIEEERSYRGIDTCRYRTFRKSFNASNPSDPEKYMYTTFHWKVLVASVLFVLIYENVIALITILIRCFIPPISRNLQAEIELENRETNKAIVSLELLRAQGLSKSQAKNTSMSKTAAVVDLKDAEGHNGDMKMT